MTEFEINGQTYRTGKLDAFKQFHLSRKIAPIIPTLIPIFVKLAAEGDKALTNDLSSVAGILEPFTTGIAEMSDETAEYVIATALSVVSRNQQGMWTTVWNSSSHVCMFDDMDLGVILRIVFRVIQDNLGPFIQGLLTNQQSGLDSKASGG